MKKLLPYLLAITALLSALACNAAPETTATRIFDPRFKTLKVEVEDNFMAPPLIRMGTHDRLIIKFDEIGEDNSFLEYRILHCDADWKPSRLIESEYVDGFNSVKIDDYAFSSATFIHYVNYLIVIPNDDLHILHSGNYLLQVYDPDDSDTILLQARFQVSENLVNTRGEVTTRTDRGHNGEWQQLQFASNYEALGNINPYQDLTVYVSQNGRESTRKLIKTPLRNNSYENYYEHLPDLIFPASNEYRRFESTSNLFPGMHVDSLRYMGSNYHVWLKPDEPRSYREYSYDRTQHGRFIVREYNSTDSDIGADYITVVFRLESDRIPGQDVFVDGEFTHGRFDSSNRMEYDTDQHAYLLQTPLKQGAYNYQYVSRPSDSQSAPTPDLIEGNKYETENEYGIEVWYRPPGARADRLVGFTTITSR